MTPIDGKIPADPKVDASLDASLSAIKQNIDQRAARDLLAKQTKVTQLPLWPDYFRATPNSVLRSSLFPAIQSKNRKPLTRKLLAASGTTTVRFTGIQFNQEDLEVWEEILHLARQHPLGTECLFSAYSFLENINRPKGKSQYEWLKATIARLKASTVEIKDPDNPNHTYGGSLIDKFARDDERKRFKLILDKNVINLFDGGYTKISASKRKMLRKKSLASWLWRFYSTHKNPFPYKVETIHSMCGSETKNLNEFRKALRRAMNELSTEEFGFIKKYWIDDTDKLFVQRTPPPKDQRSLPDAES